MYNIWQDAGIRTQVAAIAAKCATNELHTSNEIHNKMKSTNLVKLRIAAFMPQQGAPTQMMASFQHAALATRAGGLFL